MDLESAQFLNHHQSKTLFGMQMNFQRQILITTKRPMRQTASTAPDGEA